MSPPDDTVWSIEPHTLAKHRILHEYLKAWYPVCAHGKFSEFTYAEGFAGPGIYEGGEPGSPVIALDVFLRNPHLLNRGQRLNILLVEDDRKRVARLQQETQKKINERGGLPPRIRITVTHGRAAEELLPALNRAAPRKAPFLAILDGWGGPGPVPFELARKVADRAGGEVLVTFLPSHLYRFANQEGPAEAGDRFFGSTDWRAVVDQPSDRKRPFLVDAYRNSLRTAGFSHIASFEMLDSQGNALHLVFATNHLTGIEKMKDAMWKVDRQSGYRFRDPRDPDQLELFLDENPALGPLKEVILNRVTDGPSQVEELRELTLSETVYCRKHATTVLTELYKQDRIATSSGRSPTKKDTVWLKDSEEPSPEPEQDPLF